MKTVRAAHNRRLTRYTRVDDDPITVLVKLHDEGHALVELRRWQAGEKTLTPDHEGVTWCEGWGGFAAQALEALVALDESRES